MSTAPQEQTFLFDDIVRELTSNDPEKFSDKTSPEVTTDHEAGDTITVMELSGRDLGAKVRIQSLGSDEPLEGYLLNFSVALLNRNAGPAFVGVLGPKPLLLNELTRSNFGDLRSVQTHPEAPVTFL